MKDGVYGFYFTGKSVSSQVENHRMVVYFPKFKKLVDIDLSALNIEERFSSQPYNYQYQYGSSLFDIEYDEYRILTFSLATKLCSSIQPKIYQCYYNGTLNAKSTTFEAYSLKNGYPHKFTAKYPFHGANDGSAWKHLPVKHSFSMIPYILGIYNETYLFTLGTVNNGNSRISHIGISPDWGYTWNVTTTGAGSFDSPIGVTPDSSALHYYVIDRVGKKAELTISSELSATIGEITQGPDLPTTNTYYDSLARYNYINQQSRIIKYYVVIGQDRSTKKVYCSKSNVDNNFSVWDTPTEITSFSVTTDIWHLAQINQLGLLVAFSEDGYVSTISNFPNFSNWTSPVQVIPTTGFNNTIKWIKMCYYNGIYVAFGEEQSSGYCRIATATDPLGPWKLSYNDAINTYYEGYSAYPQCISYAYSTGNDVNAFTTNGRLYLSYYAPTGLSTVRYYLHGCVPDSKGSFIGLNVLYSSTYKYRLFYYVYYPQDTFQYAGVYDNTSWLCRGFEYNQDNTIENEIYSATSNGYNFLYGAWDSSDKWNNTVSSLNNAGLSVVNFNSTHNTVFYEADSIAVNSDSTSTNKYPVIVEGPNYVFKNYTSTNDHHTGTTLVYDTNNDKLHLINENGIISAISAYSNNDATSLETYLAEEFKNLNDLTKTSTYPITDHNFAFIARSRGGVSSSDKFFNYGYVINTTEDEVDPTPTVYYVDMRNNLTYLSDLNASESGGHDYDIHLIAIADDDTSNWTTPMTNLVSGSRNYNSITYGNGKFVMAGSSGYITTSPDGVHWSEPAKLINTTYPVWLSFGNGLFIAKYAEDGTAYISTSTDGDTWTTPARVSALDTRNNTYMAYGNGKFVALTPFGQISTSTDGTTWTPWTSVITTNSISGLAYGNGKFIAVSNLVQDITNIYTSIDGTTWSNAIEIPELKRTGMSLGYNQGNDWTMLIYGGGKFILATSLGFQAFSENGTDWSYPVYNRNLGSVWKGASNNYGWSSIAYGNRYIICGYENQIAISTTI